MQETTGPFFIQVSNLPQNTHPKQVMSQLQQMAQFRPGEIRVNQGVMSFAVRTIEEMTRLQELDGTIVNESEVGKLISHSLHLCKALIKSTSNPFS
jgi:hypothetical protein